MHLQANVEEATAWREPPTTKVGSGASHPLFFSPSMSVRG